MSTAIQLIKFTTGYVSPKGLRTSLLEVCNFLHGLTLSLGGNVNVNNLSTILDNMGIKLADEELRDLTQNLPVDGEQVFRYHI